MESFFSCWRVRKDRSQVGGQIRVVEGHIELFEAKWTKLSTDGDAVNLDLVRKVVGKITTS